MLLDSTVADPQLQFGDASAAKAVSGVFEEDSGRAETAMAGMLLSGDPTFTSFAVGTMTVVAVAMFASISILPAVCSRSWATGWGRGGSRSCGGRASGVTGAGSATGDNQLRRSRSGRASSAG